MNFLFKPNNVHDESCCTFVWRQFVWTQRILTEPSIITWVIPHPSTWPSMSTVLDSDYSLFLEPKGPMLFLSIIIVYDSSFLWASGFPPKHSVFDVELWRHFLIASLVQSSFLWCFLSIPTSPLFEETEDCWILLFSKARLLALIQIAYYWAILETELVWFAHLCGGWSLKQSRGQP